MQLLDKDKVKRTFAHKELLLHELISGHFQFGQGPEAEIVTRLEQVEAFPEDVRHRVKDWLERGGPTAAAKDKRARVIAENSKRETSGMLDALVEAAGGEELKGQILEVVQAFLKQRGEIPNKPPVEVQHLDTGGAFVVDADGVKHYEPHPEDLEAEQERAELLRRELEEPDAGALEDPELVGAAVGAPVDPDLGSMTEEGKKRPRPRRRTR